MRNSRTRLLLAYWARLPRGTSGVPQRADVSPRGIKRMLPFVFLADAPGSEATMIRLAGTGLCERYGRELRDHNLQAMWTPKDRIAVRGLISNVLKERRPGLATFLGESLERRQITGEMLLLPLADETGAVTKLLGSVFAVEPTARFGRRPIVHQHLIDTDLLEAPYDLDVTETPAEVTVGMTPPDALVTEAPDHDTAIRRKGHLRLVVSRTHDGEECQAAM